LVIEILFLQPDLYRSAGQLFPGFSQPASEACLRLPASL
jgi:hypothetical protein